MLCPLEGLSRVYICICWAIAFGAEINDSFCIQRMHLSATERIEGKRAGEKGPEK